MPFIGGIGFSGARGAKPPIVNEGSSTSASFSNITDGEKSYRLATYNSSGSFVVSEEGYAEVLVIGGGGASGEPRDNWAAGPGIGGGRLRQLVYFYVGTYTVIIGAGGAPGIGQPSTVYGNQVNIYVPGGGRGGQDNLPGATTVSPVLNGAFDEHPYTTSFRGISETYSTNGGNATNSFPQNTGFGGGGSPSLPAGGFRRNGASGRVAIRWEL